MSSLIDPVLLGKAVVKLEKLIVGGDITFVQLHSVILAIIDSPHISLKTLDICHSMRLHYCINSDPTHFCSICEFPADLLGRAAIKLNTLCYGPINTFQLTKIIENCGSHPCKESVQLVSVNF